MLWTREIIILSVFLPYPQGKFWNLLITVDFLPHLEWHDRAGARKSLELKPQDEDAVFGLQYIEKFASSKTSTM